MCGRYVLAMRYGQAQRVLEEHGLPTSDFHRPFRRGRDYWGGDGGDAEGEEVGERERDEGDARDNGDKGEGDEAAAPDTAAALFRPSYNFAPGFHGLVVRPVGDDGRGQGTEENAKYQLQVMKWGLVSSWMRRRPDDASALKTINCRADSLVSGSGMWAGLRSRRRCVVVASGFYEWLHKGPRERVPHYIRRRDGLPLLMAGLWERSAAEGKADDDGEYTYTIITTDSNATLRFLHDRMPVLLDYGSAELAAWLDAGRAWSAELARVLRPWAAQDNDSNGDGRSLLADVVGKEVNKTGHSAASYIVPVASADNKANIANFFGAAAAKKRAAGDGASDAEPEASGAEPEASGAEPEAKRRAVSAESKQDKQGKQTQTPKTAKATFISSTRNNKTPGKAVKAARAGSTQKITSFFKKTGS